MRRIGLTIVTVLALFVTPAFADVVTVCSQSNLVPLQAAQYSSPARLSQTLAGAGPRLTLGEVQRIALAHDDKGFDVVLNWHGEGELSLRASGADILDMALGSNLVHLMVAKGGDGIEHFLFSLDDEGAGELLWGGSPDGVDAGATRSVCTGPR